MEGSLAFHYLLYLLECHSFETVQHIIALVLDFFFGVPSGQSDGENA